MTADEEDAEARWHNLVVTDPGASRARRSLFGGVFATILFATLLGLIGSHLGSLL